MKVETCDIKALKHPEQNVRIHTEAQIREIARSIEMFGQFRPVILDEDNIILAGNGLVMAMKLLAKKKVEYIRMGGLSNFTKEEFLQMIVKEREYSKAQTYRRL